MIIETKVYKFSFTLPICYYLNVFLYNDLQIYVQFFKILTPGFSTEPRK